MLVNLVMWSTGKTLQGGMWPPRFLHQRWGLGYGAAAQPKSGPGSSRGGSAVISALTMGCGATALSELVPGSSRGHS